MSKRDFFKEAYMIAHEQEMEEYLEEHPDATEAEAYEKTADAACGRMVENLTAQADAYADRDK